MREVPANNTHTHKIIDGIVHSRPRPPPPPPRPFQFKAGTIEDRVWFIKKLKEVRDEIQEVENFLLHDMHLDTIKILRQQARASNEKGIVADKDQTSKARGAPPRTKRRTMGQKWGQNQTEQLRITARYALNTERRSTESMIRKVQGILNDKLLEAILNHKDPIQTTIRTRLQSLLEKLMTHLKSLGPVYILGGGSRKRRHGKRRKTRRKKKRRKRKSIKKRRKRGRKTRRK